jgi:hypothetical protein
MVLVVHSNVGYLNELNTNSHAGGHHNLSEDVPVPPNKCTVQNIAEIITAIMSSAADANVVPCI